MIDHKNYEVAYFFTDSCLNLLRQDNYIMTKFNYEVTKIYASQAIIMHLFLK